MCDQALGGGESRNLSFDGDRFPVSEDGKVLEVEGGDSYTTV